MSYFWGVLAGLIWGSVCAVLNGLVTKKCVAKNTSAAMSAANIIKIIVDIMAFVVVFLLRNILPFNYEATIIGTVLALAMLQIVITFKIANS